MKKTIQVLYEKYDTLKTEMEKVGYDIILTSGNDDTGIMGVVEKKKRKKKHKKCHEKLMMMMLMVLMMVIMVMMMMVKKNE